MRNWLTRQALTDLLVKMSKWIGCYNNRRLHSALRYRPLTEIHQEWKKCQASAA